MLVLTPRTSGRIDADGVELRPLLGDLARRAGLLEAPGLEEPHGDEQFASMRGLPGAGGASAGVAFALEASGWKLIEREGTRPELYDLATDPGELHDRALSDPGVTTRLHDRIVGLARERGSPLLDEQDVREALEAVGYLGN